LAESLIKPKNDVVSIFSFFLIILFKKNKEIKKEEGGGSGPPWHPHFGQGGGESLGQSGVVEPPTPWQNK